MQKYKLKYKKKNLFLEVNQQLYHLLNQQKKQVKNQICHTLLEQNKRLIWMEN